MLIPLPTAALCALSNMLSGVPRASLPPHFYEWWLIAAPAFPIFLVLSELVELLPLDYATESRISSVLLALCFLFWAALILLPFWRPFRLRGLSLLATRIAFLTVGATLAVWTWWEYYGGPNGYRGE